jgi:hypothetical protein
MCGWKRKTEEERKEEKKKRKMAAAEEFSRPSLDLYATCTTKGRIPPSFYSTSLTLTPFPWCPIARYDASPLADSWQPRGEESLREMPMRLPNTLRNRAELDCDRPIGSANLMNQIPLIFDLSR